MDKSSGDKRGPAPSRVVCDHKALVKTLTPVATSALETAVMLCVAERQTEVRVMHFISGVVGQERSDYAAALDLAGVDRHVVRRALERRIREEPGSSTARPTFSPLLMLLFQDAWWDLVPESPVKRIRTGALVAHLFAKPGRYHAEDIVARVRALGATRTLTDVSPELRRSLLEDAQSLEQAPKVIVRKPRRLVVHTAVENEALVDVARRYAVDLEDLANDNGLDLDARLERGASVRIRVLVELPSASPQWAYPTETKTEAEGEAETEAETHARHADMFARLRANGWDTSSALLYGYFFVDHERRSLEQLGRQLVKEGFKLVEIAEREGGYMLHVERIEAHDARSLGIRTRELRTKANAFNVEYDGMDVGRVAS